MITWTLKAGEKKEIQCFINLYRNNGMTVIGLRLYGKVRKKSSAMDT